MNELTVKGTQPFMGKAIPIVLGGFGPDAKCISDKTAAEIHGQPEREIRRRITDNLAHFTDGVDYIDLIKGVGEGHTLELLTNLGYSKQAITQAEHIYILSERGYFKLVKILNSDQAWDIYENLLNDYFTLRDDSKNTLAALSPELQMFKAIFDSVAKTELQQKQQARAIEAVDRKVTEIREIVGINPLNWRRECNAVLGKIAEKLGGIEQIRDLHCEVYRRVDERGHANLNQRLENLKGRCLREGGSKTEAKRFTKLDVIGRDPRLTEIYISIVKELSIAHGVSFDKANEN